MRSSLLSPIIKLITSFCAYSYSPLSNMNTFWWWVKTHYSIGYSFCCHSGGLSFPSVQSTVQTKTKSATDGCTIFSTISSVGGASQVKWLILRIVNHVVAEAPKQLNPDKSVATVCSQQPCAMQMLPLFLNTHTHTPREMVRFGHLTCRVAVSDYTF